MEKEGSKREGENESIGHRLDGAGSSLGASPPDLTTLHQHAFQDENGTNSASFKYQNDKRERAHLENPKNPKISEEEEPAFEEEEEEVEEEAGAFTLSDEDASDSTFLAPPILSFNKQ